MKTFQQFMETLPHSGVVTPKQLIGIIELHDSCIYNMTFNNLLCYLFYYH